MAINGISGTSDFLSGYGISKNTRGGTNAGINEEPDIDKEENDKLASKIYLAGTTSDATAAYFGALQEAVKDSKNGFEANRRVNRLTSTHEKIVSSEEYANKPEAKSVVKDLTDAMEEKRKEIDGLVEKRKEKDEAGKSDEKTAFEKNRAVDNVAERLSAIPNLGQYEDLIGRFLSGESEMESADKPLTDDQIARRGFMREYMRTDTRSMSQIAADMKQANKSFLDYWMKNGNGGPTPGHIVSADGSFKIFNSKAEKDEFINNQKMDFLKDVMSVIKAGKTSGLDIKV